MKATRVFFMGMLLMGLVSLGACEKDEDTTYEINAIDKEEVEEPDDRD
ncbi:hypothetical protein MTsPCn5_19240 [Croceitalea sp. MTPC5]|nr:hypothetical protein MTsPCn5_19240 [Croceitalea sp. MTPC5]